MLEIRQKSLHLGPQLVKIHRYLLVVFVAKSIQMFRLGFGKEIDNSIYFTLYGLGKLQTHLSKLGLIFLLFITTGQKLQVEYTL